MKYNPQKHHRRSIRLKGYDYSQAGLYFITICVKDFKCLFGKIENVEMLLNDAGIMMDAEWIKITDRFQNVKLHEYIIMPNHFHCIMEIIEDGRATTRVATTDSTDTTDAPNKKKTVGDIVGAFQSIVTVEYIRGVKDNDWIPFNKKLFQRNYYEHIIRNEQSYQRISDYIINNPKNWKGDKFYE